MTRGLLLVFIIIFLVSCRKRDYSKYLVDFSTGLVFTGSKVSGKREEFSPYSKEICLIARFREPVDKNALIEHVWVQATEKRVVYRDTFRLKVPQALFRLKWVRDEQTPFVSGDYRVSLLIDKKPIKETLFTISSDPNIYNKYKENPGLIIKTEIKITSIDIGLKFDKEKEVIENPSTSFKSKDRFLYCLVQFEGENLSGSKFKATWINKDKGFPLGSSEQLLEKGANKALFSYKTKKKLENGEYEIQFYFNDKSEPEKVVSFKVQ